MASLSGKDNLRNIDWIRLALAEGRYHVRAWGRLQVGWSSQDNNLEVSANQPSPHSSRGNSDICLVQPRSTLDRPRRERSRCRNPNIIPRKVLLTWSPAL